MQRTIQTYAYFETGQDINTRNSIYQNRLIVKDHLYLDNVLDFDVLLFNVVQMQNNGPPHKRSQSQVHVFVGIEPAAHKVPEKFEI